MMPEILSIEEQKVNQAIKRLLRINWIGVGVGLSFAFSGLFYMMLSHAHHDLRTKVGEFALTAFFGSLLLALWYLNTCYRKYVKEFSAQEIAILRSKAASNGQANYDASIAKALILKYDRLKPEQELLRASQPTENGDTLLRAAQHSDETPQGQLLRPTSNHEPMT